MPLPTITPSNPLPNDNSEKIIGEVMPVQQVNKNKFLGKYWPIFAVLIVVILGAVAFFVFRSKLSTVNQKTAEEQTATEVAIPTVTSTPTPSPSFQQSNSDETSAIETDLNNTDLTNIDKEVATVEGELAK